MINEDVDWIAKYPFLFRTLFSSLTLLFFNCYVIILLWYFIRRKYKLSIKSLGFIRVELIKNLLLGIVIGTSIFVLLRLGYSLISGISIFQPHFEEEKIYHIIFVTFFLTLITVSCEESFYRGFCYPVFRNKFGVFRGILVTSLIFTLAHYFRFDFFYTWLVSIPIEFVTALSFGILYEKTRSVFAPITAHLIFNYLGYFL